MSRVVPAISDVIAASRPAKAFNNVDFPTLGAPTMATSNPLRIRSATNEPSISRCKSITTSFRSAFTSGVTSTGTSSSAKSIVASIRAAERMSFVRHISTFWPSSPDRTRSAWRLCASVSASISSAKPSTCARSSFPFSRARLVNSPASAMRAPSAVLSASRTARTTATLPCKCNSTVSSPVKLRGPAKVKTSAVSICVPSEAAIVLTPKVPISGNAPHISRAISKAAGPEIRTTDTPARPCAEASAKIVSDIFNPLLSNNKSGVH